MQEGEDEFNQDPRSHGVKELIEERCDPHGQADGDNVRYLFYAQQGHASETRAEPQIFPEPGIDGKQQQKNKRGAADGEEAKVVSGVGPQIGQRIPVEDDLHAVRGRHHVIQKMRTVYPGRSPLRETAQDEDQPSILSEGSWEREDFAGIGAGVPEGDATRTANQVAVGINLVVHGLFLQQDRQLRRCSERLGQSDFITQPVESKYVQILAGTRLPFASRVNSVCTPEVIPSEEKAIPGGNAQDTRIETCILREAQGSDGERHSRRQQTASCDSKDRMFPQHSR